MTATVARVKASVLLRCAFDHQQVAAHVERAGGRLQGPATRYGGHWRIKGEAAIACNSPYLCALHRSVKR